MRPQAVIRRMKNVARHTHGGLLHVLKIQAHSNWNRLGVALHGFMRQYVDPKWFIREIRQTSNCGIVIVGAALAAISSAVNGVAIAAKAAPTKASRPNEKWNNPANIKTR